MNDFYLTYDCLFVYHKIRFCSGKIYKCLRIQYDGQWWFVTYGKEKKNLHAFLFVAHKKMCHVHRFADYNSTLGWSGSVIETELFFFLFLVGILGLGWWPVLRCINICLGWMDRAGRVGSTWKIKAPEPVGWAKPWGFLDDSNLTRLPTVLEILCFFIFFYFVGNR